jgi:rubrerythrin
MLWALLRYLDPIAHRKRQEDLRRQREDWPPDINPDDTDLTLPPESTVERKLKCRICGHVGPEPRFCPVCLAETMR